MSPVADNRKFLESGDWEVWRRDPTEQRRAPETQKGLGHAHPA